MPSKHGFLLEALLVLSCKAEQYLPLQAVIANDLEHTRPFGYRDAYWLRQRPSASSRVNPARQRGNDDLVHERLPLMLGDRATEAFEAEVETSQDLRSAWLCCPSPRNRLC